MLFASNSLSYLQQSFQGVIVHQGCHTMLHCSRWDPFVSGYQGWCSIAIGLIFGVLPGHLNSFFLSTTTLQRGLWKIASLAFLCPFYLCSFSSCVEVFRIPLSSMFMYVLCSCEVSSNSVLFARVPVGIWCLPGAAWDLLSLQQKPTFAFSAAFSLWLVFGSRCFLDMVDTAL